MPPNPRRSGGFNYIPKKGYKQTKEHRNETSKARMKRKKELGYINSFEVRQKMSKAKMGNKNNLGKHWNVKDTSNMKGRIFTEETRKKMGDSHKEEKSNLWKGENAGYRAKHHWINKYYGKSDICEHCLKDKLKGREIHWANISGKYERDRSDWLRLCIKCHAVFDKSKRKILWQLQNKNNLKTK